MARLEPEQVWWTADELAASGLPGLPTTGRAMNLLAKRSGWRSAPNAARKKAGRGGGWQYHWSLLPVEAQQRLLRVASEPKERSGLAPDWAAFDDLPDQEKDIAKVRVAAVDEVQALHAAGQTQVAAVDAVALANGVSARTIYNWLRQVEGVPAEHRMAALARRYKSANRQKRVTIDPTFYELIRNDWLRLDGPPSLTSCYDRAVIIAKAEGLDIAPIHQVRRQMKADISKPVEVMRRKGLEALKRYFPHQTRDKSAMHVMECVQGDYHKFDVFVSWPSQPLPVRVQMVAFSDVYSGKFLSHRLSLTANSQTVQLAIGDIVDQFGIPESFLLDNGREFAAKVVTGQAPTRNRYVIKEDDIPGLIPTLGAKVHWATPYSGQSKPIERAFRDMCDRVAKHPAFAGAYTGNKPDAKPENYGSKAVDLDVFREVLAQEIEHHNARQGRRSEVAFGRSFNDVFEEGFKTSPIRRATEEQRRMWLLSAEGVRTKADNGEFTLYGSRFWSEWMYRIAGSKIVARFDPDNLHGGVHVYQLDGSHLGFANCLKAGDFLSVEDAKTHARNRRDFIRKTRKAADAERTLTTHEIAARLKNATPDAVPASPEPSVVQLVPAHPQAPRRQHSDEERERETKLGAHVTNLAERMRTAKETDEPPEDRFARALALEKALDDGEAVTASQRGWLADYQTTAEYAGRVRMQAHFDTTKNKK